MCVAAPFSVLDDTQQLVITEAPAHKIVTLSPHAAELVIAAGAIDRLVGVADFHDYPETLKNIPRVSGFTGLDREQFLTLQPDLVIGWLSGSKAADIAWIKQQKIPLYLSEPQQLLQIARTIEDIGILTQTSEKAHQAAQQFRHDLATACPSRKHHPLETAYYEIWPDPAMTIGGSHWLNEVLSIAALRNIFADQPRHVFTVAAEALLARPAQVKISNFSAQNPTFSTRLVASNPFLARPGPNIIKGLNQLCKNL